MGHPVRNIKKKYLQETLLHIAAGSGNLALVKFLLSRGLFSFKLKLKLEKNKIKIKNKKSKKKNKKSKK